MDKILQSCFSLCKIENNGKFKSEKQSAFLLSQFDKDHTYTAITAACYGNLVNWTVTADQSGIVSIIKTADKSGKTAVYFQRRTDEEQTALITEREFEAKQRLADHKQYLFEQIAYHEKVMADRKSQDDLLLSTVAQLVTEGKTTQQQFEEIKTGIEYCTMLVNKNNLLELEKYKSQLLLA